MSSPLSILFRLSTNLFVFLFYALYDLYFPSAASTLPSVASPNGFLVDRLKANGYSLHHNSVSLDAQLSCPNGKVLDLSLPPSRILGLAFNPQQREISIVYNHDLVPSGSQYYKRLLVKLGLLPEGVISVVRISSFCQIAERYVLANLDWSLIPTSISYYNFPRHPDSLAICTPSSCLVSLRRAKSSRLTVTRSPNDIQKYHLKSHTSQCLTSTGRLLERYLSVIYNDNLNGEFPWRYRYAVVLASSSPSTRDPCITRALKYLRVSYSYLAHRLDLLQTTRYSLDKSSQLYLLHFGLFVNDLHQLSLLDTHLSQKLRAFLSTANFVEEPVDVVYNSYVYPYLRYRRGAMFWASNRTVPQNYVSGYALGLLRLGYVNKAFDLMTLALVSSDNERYWSYWLDRGLGWFDPFSRTPLAIFYKNDNLASLNYALIDLQAYNEILAQRGLLSVGRDLYCRRMSTLFSAAMDPDQSLLGVVSFNANKANIAAFCKLN